MKKVILDNNMKIIGIKNFNGKDRKIDFYLITKENERLYAFSNTYTHTVLMRQSNLSAVGVKKVSDMKELAITFEYEMNRNKKRTTEIFLEPHEVKE